MCNENDELLEDFIDVNDVYEDDPEWLIKDLLPTGLVLIASPPKSLKSTWAVAMAAQLAGAYRTPFKRAIEDQDELVLLLSAEATAPVIRHMLVNDLQAKLPLNGLFRVCDDVVKFRLDKKTGLKRLLHILEKVNPKLCVIDPLRNFHGGDENDSGLMYDILAPLRAWAIANSNAVIVVHHVRKPPTLKVGDEMMPLTPNDMRGSSALFGIADGVIIITPQGKRSMISTTFKRAASWTKLVQLGVFGEKGRIIKEITND